jgi:hypothetical protein
MKYPAIISLLLIYLFSTPLYAKCDNDSQTLFFCKIQKSGKLLEVCDAGKTINYSFGKANKKPELALALPRNKVSTYQWSGVGRYENYSVMIPNGDTTYNVFWGIDKLAEGFPVEAGVTVEIKGREVARILCVNNTVVHKLIGVNLKSIEY